jgi:hypothetical protein
MREKRQRDRERRAEAHKQEEEQFRLTLEEHAASMRAAGAPSSPLPEDAARAIAYNCNLEETIKARPANFGINSGRISRAIEVARMIQEYGSGDAIAIYITPKAGNDD